MHYVLRLGGDHAQRHYPLPVSGVAQWTTSGRGTERVHEWSHTLPEIPAGHIIVPSFACRSTASRHQFTLRVTAPATESHPLHSVPSDAADTPEKSDLSHSAVSSHIDCWHTEKDIRSSTVSLRVSSTTVDDALLTLSVRPLEEAPQVPSDLHIAGAEPVATSQMLAVPAIRSRICSPTALFMALSIRPGAPDWPSTVEACYDPLTKAYGSWPLAIRWAAANGTLGAVETISDWSTVAHILRAGSLPVCSIRFDKDQLPGAPLRQTGGHLVLLRGVQGDAALVYDPAAPTNEKVAHHYSLASFSAAWLHRRGAAYVFCAN